MNNLIEEANKAYYNEDEPILTDKEFDLLSDNGLEMKNFRNKVDHFQPMGSLKKIKSEEDFIKWIETSKIRRITPKLDGNSVEIIVKNNIIKQAITRGNGFTGNDISDRIKYCYFQIPLTPIDGELRSFKCEAIMPKEYQKDYDKNIRNVVAGILNSKDPDPKELEKIHIISFDRLENLKDQFLNDYFYEDLEYIFNYYKENREYEIDGLVVEIDPIHEEKDPLLPENIVALKFNKEGVDAEVGDIEWNIGKHQKLTPVLILKNPVEIDGTMVGRVSASNFQLLKEVGLNKGAKIQVIKSGDIIPFVSKVVEPVYWVDMPKCPVCGFYSKVEGVNVICPNKKCSAIDNIKIKNFFSILDLEFISDATIEKLIETGFNSIEKIFEIKKEQIKNIPGFGESKANNIISKFKKAEIDDYNVLASALIKGVSGKQSQRLIKHFGSLKGFLLSYWDKDELIKIDGMGDILAGNIVEGREEFIKMFEIISKYVRIKEEKKSESKLKVVCTGKCEQYGRKELEKLLADKGIEMQGGVGKDTDYVVTDDVNSNSGKMKKAKQLGIQIKTYNEFLEDI